MILAFGLDCGALVSRGPKGPKRVDSESRSIIAQLFLLLRGLFQTFWTLVPRGPGNSLADFFSALGPKGQVTPVAGQESPQGKNLSCKEFGTSTTF